MPNVLSGSVEAFEAPLVATFVYGINTDWGINTGWLGKAVEAASGSPGMRPRRHLDIYAIHRP